MNARIGTAVLMATLAMQSPQPARGAELVSGVAPADQQKATASVTGRVVEDRTNRPLPSVQVGLTERALDLDAIVVTGTVGGTQRRAIGNVVETVDVSKVMAVTPVTNVEQLLGQRTAGLLVLPSAGQVGTGAPLRIRGVSSMSLANEPLVFIDGVRMESSPRQGPGQRGGSRVSRLTDLNPEDIQSIEVIKGPSAATLYGTEASVHIARPAPRHRVDRCEAMR
jgi:outer membrane cobalamin receptor